MQVMFVRVSRDNGTLFPVVQHQIAVKEENAIRDTTLTTPLVLFATPEIISTYAMTLVPLMNNLE